MASRTALALVQGVMGKLRDERVSAFPSPIAEPTETILDLVNNAKEEVLEDRVWSFDIYDDKKFVFLAKQSGTGGFATDASTTFLIQLGSFTLDLFVGTVTPIRLRIVCSNGDTPNTSYIVRKAVIAAGITLTLASEYMGGDDAGSAEWETHCNEALLPSDVRKLVWASHQETPLALRGMPDFFHFDARFPRPQDHASDQPSLYVSGRSFQNTWSDDATVSSSSGAADTTAFGIQIFPVPVTRQVIDYAYVKRHSRLSDGSDTVSGVPDRVLDLIEWKACVHALYSQKDSDYVHARNLDSKVERDIRRAHGAISPTPSVRQVPVPFGSTRRSYFHRRYLDEEVPTP